MSVNLMISCSVMNELVFLRYIGLLEISLLM